MQSTLTVAAAILLGVESVRVRSRELNSTAAAANLVVFSMAVITRLTVVLIVVAMSVLVPIVAIIMIRAIMILAVVTIVIAITAVTAMRVFIRTRGMIMMPAVPASTVAIVAMAGRSAQFRTVLIGFSPFTDSALRGLALCSHDESIAELGYNLSRSAGYRQL